MIETVYPLAQGDAKVIEKVLLGEHLHYLHMILPPGDSLPVHDTNAPLYMTVVRGRLRIALGEQDAHEYPASTMLALPAATRMHAQNPFTDTLELIVVKASAPSI